MSALRTHVRMFKQRFAPGIRSGAKDTTIRPTPKREIRVGDLIEMRVWKGRPYWSPQVKIALGVCIEVQPVEIELRWNRALISLGGANPMFSDRAHGFAQRDGFESAAEMVEWFDDEHGLPFRGIWIRWSLLKVAKI